MDMVGVAPQAMVEVAVVDLVFGQVCIRGCYYKWVWFNHLVL